MSEQDTRTLRKCVRVIITNGNSILLCKKYIKGKFSSYIFPGGGFDNGDDLINTAIKECLEEVGILIKNVKPIGLEITHEFEFDKPERAKLYKGSTDIWVTAEYVRKDDSKHDSEGDAVPYTWETMKNARDKINSASDKEYIPDKLQALDKLEEMIKDKKSLENW